MAQETITQSPEHKLSPRRATPSKREYRHATRLDPKISPTGPFTNFPNDVPRTADAAAREAKDDAVPPASPLLPAALSAAPMVGTRITGIVSATDDSRFAAKSDRLSGFLHGESELLVLGDDGLG